MKKVWLLAAMVFFAALAFADTEEVDGIVWTYSVSNGEAMIGTTGSPAIYLITEGAITVPSTLGGYPLTTIGSGAFCNCSDVESVSIPAGVTSIAGAAFSFCRNIISFSVDSANPNYSSVNGMLCSKDGTVLVSGVNGSVLISPSVTSIGDYAFCGRDNLVSIAMSGNVTSIGKRAFEECRYLPSITLSEGLVSIGEGAFCACGFNTVAIPASVTSIDGNVFSCCASLGEITVDAANPKYCSNGGMLCTKDGKTLVSGVNGAVTVPAGVTSIGEGAFLGYDGLTGVTIPSGVTEIGEEAFADCASLCTLTMASSVKTIGDHAFCDCTGITSVTLPSELESIGTGSFCGCTGIEKISISLGVTNIGVQAFAYCDALAEVTIPQRFADLNDDIFEGCGEIAYTFLPDPELADGGPYVETVGGVEWTFFVLNGKSRIAKDDDDKPAIPATVTGAIEVPSELGGHPVTAIGDWAFCTCGITSVKIPSGITFIGDNVFTYCPNLEFITVADENVNYSSLKGMLCTKDNRTLLSGINGDVVIPPEITAIGESAFKGMDGLTSVVIPESVINIDRSAFMFCSGLAEVSIPSNVTSIGESAFSDCDGLTSVEIAEGVKVIGGEAFADCDGLLSVEIPSGVTNIGILAFSYCRGMTSAKVPLSVKTIGDGAFEGCENLVAATIPQRFAGQVENIFGGCAKVVITYEQDQVDPPPVQPGNDDDPPVQPGDDDDPPVQPGDDDPPPVQPGDDDPPPVQPGDDDPVVDPDPVKPDHPIVPSIGPDPKADEPIDLSAASTYDGAIVDADGVPVGTINVKTAKPTRTGVSKVTATVQMAGETKKVTMKGNLAVEDSVLTVKASDGRELELDFTRNSVSGVFDGYGVDGARNLVASTAKSREAKEEKAAADAVLNGLKGNFVLAYVDENGCWNGLSVSIAAKGKVKVTGTLANGTKVTASSQLIIGEEFSCIPVFYAKKGVALSFSIYIDNDSGEKTVFGLADWVVSPVSGLTEECTFNIGGEIYDLFDGYILAEELLPNGLSVVQNKSKWVVADGAKAGMIKLVDGEAIDTKESANPSGLKLTFTARSGAFKGSFKVYALDAKGKLKTFSASVTGIVVDGVGYGTATIKKVGSFAIAVD